MITGGRLVNVHTREVLDGVDVAVKHGRVAMFGDAAHTRGPETEMIDAEGAYLVPGLIDTHLHVESVMVTVTRFAEAVLPHGTTAAFIDNHEMANVFGLDGIRWMLEEGRALPLKVFLAVPSCVPALPGVWVRFREGSTFRDVEALVPVLTEDGVDSRHCLLVTDDVHPETIVSDGHMDRAVRAAIAAGLDPLVAIQMATVSPAEYMG